MYINQYMEPVPSTFQLLYPPTFGPLVSIFGWLPKVIIAPSSPWSWWMGRMVPRLGDVTVDGTWDLWFGWIEKKAEKTTHPPCIEECFTNKIPMDERKTFNPTNKISMNCFVCLFLVILFLSSSSFVKIFIFVVQWIFFRVFWPQRFRLDFSFKIGWCSVFFFSGEGGRCHFCRHCCCCCCCCSQICFLPFLII